METKFNFKSSPCTTIEQSRRLLELGLKKETADMFYSAILENNDIARVCYEDFWNSSKAIDGYIRRRCLPAWSLHRLIELAYGNWKEDIAPIYLGNSYDMLIGRIEFQVKQGKFNKEYLEG